MSEIFENAIDSLKLGLQYYISDNFESAKKHAILTIYHSIELLLKERLFRVDPILIYQNIDKPINEDTNTVGLKSILIRYQNLKILLSKNEHAILYDLQKRRNRIEHHKYQRGARDDFVVEKSLRFIYYFLPNHLESSLESAINDDCLYDKVREIILSYEERLKEAEEEVSKRTSPDPSDPTYIGTCPECGTETIVIGTDKGDYCFLCRESFEFETCDYCGEYFPQDEINEFGNCDDCFNHRMEKF